MPSTATGETAVYRGRTAFGPTSQYGRTGEGLPAIAKALAIKQAVRVFLFICTVCIYIPP